MRIIQDTHLETLFEQFTVEDGQRVLMTELNGTMSLLVGPRRIWRGWRRFESLDHHVAHPGEFLIVKHRDGHEEQRPARPKYGSIPGRMDPS